MPEAHWEKVMTINTLAFKSVTLSARREQRLLTPDTWAVSGSSSLQCRIVSEAEVKDYWDNSGDFKLKH